MKKVFIHISGVYDITQFVDHARKVIGPGVYVHKGSVIIDGTSLLGMLALDTTNGIEVEFPTEAKEFEQFLQQFVGD